ncbi:disintegrin and metalloproteinase domain-containing protein 9 [Stomoxys calcitrans]|uniref:disintegrin and metalloproteinase domain-containing protein 9 n=1 Tax=Stomoxys calcitrans TaxID=35570 RepID=UPI0027E3081E|nr:disintegrin and metalloproteinase domain-containing protein 9 [Stomoxys calcitrans]XP_059217906.1 disintegrin and metalloproteinase domain-containing protein 9 [Stomoxys calcitrans]XP_059217907.1 disintegrin and metalloproteinase domain-containing protein 9 [Stomoxys calcitrans]
MPSPRLKQHRQCPLLHRQYHHCSRTAAVSSSPSSPSLFHVMFCTFAFASICLPMSMDAAAANPTTTNIKTDTQSKASLPASTLSTTGASSAAFAAAAIDDFSSHSVIYPKIHHARHKRELRHTLDTDGLHVPHITLTYHHKGQRILIDLKRNDNLLPDEHFLRYQNSNSTKGHTVKTFTKTEIDLCHYQGSIRDKPQSYVAVSTCNGGVNGVIFDGIDTYFIHSGSDGQLEDEHLLFRHSDFNKNATCGYDHDHHNEKEDFLQKVAENKVPNVVNHIDGAEFNRILRYKRSYDDNNMIRGPYNSNKHSSYVEIVIVVDNKAYKSFSENTKKVHQHCKDLANIMNALYVPLNIFIALVGVVIWNESNEIEITPDADITLRNFLNYRRTKLVLEHPNDSAQLLTKIKFDKGVVGKAFKGPICTHEYSGSVNVEHSPIVGVVATTMAHELGHNFGMEHDSSDCKCQDEKCIMSASSTSVLPVHWSSCSIDQLNIAFSHGMNYCLRNKPTKLFDSPQCGNGFVEPGEQCDCGLPAYCENTCCDPYTCMLHTNASCATGECCDLATCRPKVAGTQCRNAENECDLPEYCTGESEYCPQDVFKRDTEECDGGQAYCYQGNCRSHTYQCRVLWGPTGETSEPCYSQMNIQGKRGGNCGYNRLNNTFIACEEENVLCGMLHCRHLNERLEFGMETAAVLSHSFITYKNDIVPCRTALVDLGLQSTDPGLTPNGAKCGEDSMCVNQKCLAIAQLRRTGMGRECPEDCNGNGICNSKGNCHCNIGFTGHTCKMPGPGGSVDSGPATNPNSHQAFQRFMYIFFFAVLPFMAAFCFFMYYCRHHPIFAGGKLAENIIKSASGAKQPPSRGGGGGSGGPHGNNANQVNANGLPKSTPSSTDDMNSALLKSPSDSNDMGNGLYGKFKGFTLRPLNDATSPTNNFSGPNVAYVQPTLQQDNSLQIPQRAAPPPPIKQEVKMNGTLTRKAPPPPMGNGVMAAPALPPPNPGSTARPIISKPVLENSTVALPLKAMGSSTDLTPSRPAPLAPGEHVKAAPPPPVPLHTDPKLNVKKDGTIRRITSFLKKDEKPPMKEKTYMDREKLKNLEISAPIPMQQAPQGESSNSDSELTPKEEETKNLVKRAQSMRSPTKKANIQSFGSMRQSGPPGSARPRSAVSSQTLNGQRPKSPPPRPPPLKKTNSTTSSGYQLPIAVPRGPEHMYDDCEFSEEAEEASPVHQRASDIADDIYSVIDEIPPAAQTLKRIDLVGSQRSSVASSNDLGLLGEIVNEMEKRNGGGESLYSAAASSFVKAKPAKEEIKRKEKEETLISPTAATLATKPPTQPASYLRPAPVNAPIARVAPTRSDLSPTTAFSSFKPTATANSRFPNNNNNTTTSSSSAVGANRGKSFTKPTLQKPLPPTSSSSTTSSSSSSSSNSQNSRPLSATIQKPKPLSAKPSFSQQGKKSNTGGISTPNGVATAAKVTPRPPTAPVSRNNSAVASLTQRFEKPANGGISSTSTTTASSATTATAGTSLRK